MKAAIQFVSVMAIFVGGYSKANATDYCPEGYYGYINGAFMYFCDYCDATDACATTGVAVASMYTCGGDFDCCVPGSTCTDPIPGSAVLSYRGGRVPLEPTPAKCPCAGKSPKPVAKATADNGGPQEPKRIPLITGVRQRKYLGWNEPFVSGRDRVTKDSDVVVRVSEPNGTDSYFRLFQVTYKRANSKGGGTIYFGMEMDPSEQPASAANATRKKKGEGEVYDHTIIYKDANYDVTSLRLLVDTP